MYEICAESMITHRIKKIKKTDHNVEIHNAARKAINKNIMFVLRNFFNEITKKTKNIVYRIFE